MGLFVSELLGSTLLFRPAYSGELEGRLF